MAEGCLPSALYLSIHGERPARTLPGQYRVAFEVRYGDPRLSRMFTSSNCTATDISAEMRQWMTDTVGPEYETWVASIESVYPNIRQCLTVVVREETAAVLVKLFWS